MCPNCRAFITVNDRVCPYCNVQLGPRAIDLRAVQLAGSLLPRANLASMVFLTINVAIFVAMVIVSYQLTKSASVNSFSGGILILFGAKYDPAIVQGGQYWRLITAGFLHGGILHIAMNSWALFDLIGEVEQFYGTSRLIVAYIFSTFTGFLLSFLFAPRALSVGASAACFGLIGIMLAVGLTSRSPLAQSVRAYYRRWAIYGLIFSFFPGLHIDVAAHLGGLAGGFLVGLVAGLPGLPNSPREMLWRVMAGIAVAVTLYAFFQDFLSYRAMIHAM